MELLGHLVILYLTFWANAKLLFTIAELFYIPTSNKWEFQCLCFLGNIYVLFLICMSLMTKDVEHLFMCVLAICVCSLEKYLAKLSFLILLKTPLHFPSSHSFEHRDGALMHTQYTRNDSSSAQSALSYYLSLAQWLQDVSHLTRATLIEVSIDLQWNEKNEGNIDSFS